LSARTRLEDEPVKIVGVTAGNFLKFLVHNRGVEIDKKKFRAIKEAPPSRSKKELRRLIGQINFPGGSSPTLQVKSSLSPHCSRQQRMKSFFRTRAMPQSCNELRMTSLRHQF